MARQNKRRRRPIPDDPIRAAREAGLVYVSDDDLGITRLRSGRGFRYRSAHGRTVRDRKELARIKALAVPPAWRSVWICPSPRGHLQATGRDERGRKQYRYHPLWRQTRDRTKYDRMIAFGEALSAMRRRIREDLASSGLPREKVLATVLQIIDLTYVRVGSPRYARENRSYGMTTMRGSHVDVNGGTIRFEFRGKGGKLHSVDVRDARLAKIIKQCQEIPGQQLFQYFDENGERRQTNSDDVNAYLQEIAGQEFTAKDFRTWAGSVLALRALASRDPADSEREARQSVNEAIEEVADALGNTVAVCRQCYVHPAVVEAFMEGELAGMRISRVRKNGSAPQDRLRPHEAAFLRFLKKRAGAPSSRDRAA